MRQIEALERIKSVMEGRVVEDHGEDSGYEGVAERCLKEWGLPVNVHGRRHGHGHHG
jgi:hypothetical protein